MNEFPHDHAFLGARHIHNERRTWIVIALTLTMMVAEITAGTLFHSMALLADGWHMSTHAGALGIAALAYGYARRNARDPRFTFGTGKLGDLAGFGSAIALGLIAVVIGAQCLERLVAPVPINFRDAIIVAVIGLGVNLVSAWLLRDVEHADHGHAASHDHNQRAAYAHVLADALTSVLAIVGLLAGSLFGWIRMDPLMGIVGACLIARWSIRLVRDAGAVLLDTAPARQLTEEIRRRLEMQGDRVLDLHVWRIAPGHHAAAVAVLSRSGRQSADFKNCLTDLEEVSHVTVEVHGAADAKT
ncbi:MAG: CDF family Co(II)/Ni(II) efflux transporter DmeF [Steroidobacteraceae bacterium]